LSSGSGTITVTDGNGCVTSSEYEILDVEAFTLTGTIINNPSCYMDSTGSAFVEARGGSEPYTYNWYPVGGENDSAQNLFSGDYIVYVTDQNGCRQKHLLK
jgi:hypothetical protein